MRKLFSGGAPAFRPSHVGAAALLVLCLAAGAASAADPVVELSTAQEKALGIETAVLRAGSGGEIAGLAAQVVVPNSQIHLVAAPVAGLVERIPVAVNGSVRAGQVLARILSPALAELQRGFVQASVQAQLAADNLQRDEALYRDGIIAESRLRATRGQHAEASAVLTERRQALHLAGVPEGAIARLASGQAQGAAIEVRAPADGVILEQMVAIGARVDAATAMFRLAKLEPLWLEIQAPVSSLARVRIGAAATVPAALPIDAFPDVSSTQVEIIVKAPGMTPEEVETRIVAPIEVEMPGIPKQRVVRSIAKYAIASIVIDFEDGTDIYWARQQVTERLNGVLPDLPPGTSGGLAPITTPQGEMFMFTIEGGNLSLAERRTLLDWTIRPRLRTVPGVADVNALGGLVRAFEVIPNTAALAARGMQIAELERALASGNRNDGAGRLADGEESLLVRAEGSIRTLDDVRAIVVGERDEIPVRIGEVADVRIGSVTRYGMVTRNGEGETVQGLVLSLRGANARDIVAGVRARLAELAPQLPPGVKTEVFYDRGQLVERAVGTVSRALIEAIVLVVILLVLFLGDLRAAIVVAATLPLAALVTFILMDRSSA
jgi:multidrug efflux pump subunit AcrA (membrane-fusion protein)